MTSNIKSQVIGKKINRKEVYEKYGGRCAYCGEKINRKAIQIDHIRPKSRFYITLCADDEIPDYHVDDIRNLNPSCRVCNYWKHNFTVEEFRNEISKQPERLRRDNGKFRFAERYGMVSVTNNPVIFYFERDIIEVDPPRSK